MFNIFRKKTIEITQIPEWKTTFEKIIVILRDNSHNAQSDWVQKINESLCDNDIDDFIKKLNSVDMWGGSGAVWEVGSFKSRDEEKEFGKLLIRLVELMKVDGISHGKAKSVSRYFKKEFNL
jgi:hypothetical protein